MHHGKPNDDGQACVLTLTVDNGRIVFDDKDDACRADTCGSRGGYSGAAFSLKRRRTIRYMPALLNSQQYRDATAPETSPDGAGSGAH